MCKPGYLGSRCEEGCPVGFYGEDCKMKCQCDKGLLCDQVTGECIHNCPAGYMGRKCNQRMTSFTILTMTSFSFVLLNFYMVSFEIILYFFIFSVAYTPPPPRIYQSIQCTVSVRKYLKILFPLKSEKQRVLISNYVSPFLEPASTCICCVVFKFSL